MSCTAVLSFKEAILVKKSGFGEKLSWSVLLVILRFLRTIPWIHLLHTFGSSCEGTVKDYMPSLDPEKPIDVLTASFLLSLAVHSLSSVWPFVTPWTAACQSPCPSPTPGVCSNSSPLSQWCHPTILSSVILFSSCQSFPASGYFLMSQLFASGGQSIGASASSSVLPMLSLGWCWMFTFGWFLSVPQSWVSFLWCSLAICKGFLSLLSEVCTGSWPGDMGVCG